MQKFLTDWLARIGIGLIVGLLGSFLLFHGQLARLEGKVDVLNENQQVLLEAMLHPDRMGPVPLKTVE